MSTTTRRILISCAVITGVICLFLSLATILGACTLILHKGPELGSLAATSTPQATLSPEEINRQMDEIQSQVISLRGLKPKQPVPRHLLTPEELRQRVVDDFLKDYTSEDAHKDAISLAAFGLLKPDFDLYSLYRDLYSEQVAGFYDHKTKEMFVVKDQGFQGPERMTYAHEYDHVLQDQNYDIENGLKYNNDYCKENSEHCAAVQSLIEGDASLLESQWLQTDATPQDIKDIRGFYSRYKSPVYDSSPEFLKEDFLFPYQSGQQFVKHIYDQGGWEAVDQVYKDLPVSTEQILHPENYPADQPVPVNLPDLGPVLGAGWDEMDHGVMGEWYTYLILAFGLNPDSQVRKSQAQQAAAGWGGDGYEVFYNEDLHSTVMALVATWDTANDVQEFKNAFLIYARGRFAGSNSQPGETYTWDVPGNYVSFSVNGLTTTWILAPDSQTAQKTIQALQKP